MYYRKLYETFDSAIIPVIPPKATLSKTSTLSQSNLGKIPGKYREQHDCWSGFSNWPDHEATEEDIALWETWPEHNVGVNARYFPGIDIDIEDQALVDEIVALLPTTKVRRREGSPRVILIYRIDEPLEFFHRLKFGDKGMVEFLGAGRFYVVQGKHKSGAEQWVTEDPITTITLQQLYDIIELLRDKFDLEEHGAEPGAVIDQDGHIKWTPRQLEQIFCLWQGSSGRHDALRDIIYYHTRAAGSDWARHHATRYMNDVPEHLRDEVWHTYYKDIDRMIKGALRITERDQVFIDQPPSQDARKRTLPMTNGRFDRLAQSVMVAAPHPNPTVAFTTAIGIIAGIAGRRFNVSGTGVNMYVALLMETGKGKDIISNYTNWLFRLAAPMEIDGSKFIGPSHFTGPRPLFKRFDEGRSRVSIMTEAGLIFGENKIGNVSGIRRALLDLFTKSGQNNFSSATDYSETENNIPAMRAPALTLISESTPRVFVDAMRARNAEESGELARMLLLKVNDQKSYFNLEHHYDLDEDTLAAVTRLMRFCYETHEDEDPQAINLQFENIDRVRAFSNACVDKQNEYELSDPFTASLYSRAWVKMVRLAVIGYLLDHEGPYEEARYVPDHYVLWAIQVIEYELHLLYSYTESATTDSLDTLIKTIMVPTIQKIIHGQSNKEVKKIISTRMRQAAVIPLSALTTALKQNRVLLDLSDIPAKCGYPKTGVTKLVNAMVEMHLLVQLKPEEVVKFGLRRDRIAYQCTKDFEAIQTRNK